MDLVLVDGPNLFNTVARFLAGQAGEHLPLLREYLLEWFDFDRLVMKALGTGSPPDLGIVVFHSTKVLGQGEYRLTAEQSRAFWARQAGNLDTSDMVVDVPGDQREHYEFVCKKCEEKNECTSVGEKGVDSSMIVYMFETAEQWQSLCIFSRDVDFVPPVWALRRRGKQVFSVGEPGDAGTALARASQSFIRMPLDALLADFGLFLLCRKDGVVDKWRSSIDSKQASGFIWNTRGVDVIVKGDGGQGYVEALQREARSLPGLVLGEGSMGSREAQQVFCVAMPFRREAPLGAWSHAIVTDARHIPNPYLAFLKG